MKTLEEKIRALLEKRGHSVELSVLTHEIKESGSDIIHAAYAMSERGDVWWLEVNEDHAIVGLPEHPKPENPLEYLDMIQMEDGALVPKDLLKRARTS